MKLHKEILNKYKSYNVKLDEGQVNKAIDYAIRYHGNQLRASGDPYYYHPIAVGEIIASMRLDSDSIVTAILHDTIEDTDLSFDDIKKEFGLEIARLVDGVTKLTKMEYKAERTKQAENFRKLLIAMSEDIRVILVKLADRLHNMRTIDYIKSAKKRHRIAQETMEIYAPIAERMGIQQIKSELQDICFRIINPESRNSILECFESIAHGKDQVIEEISDEIQAVIAKEVPSVQVIGRKKTPYSTWMKMQLKNVDLTQLYDIIGFRVIVDSVTDCYKALGIIHQKYMVVPSHFQDFISTPKNNGYRSLHTVVIGPGHHKIEVQIRTQEMHQVAELGVAAHWCYKQGHDGNPDGRQYKWIRELLSILNQDADPEEFLQHTKMAIHYDQVFCFTPKGELIALPKGATVVDFAYAVHTDIGNYCVGAKVNNKIAPLKKILVNGDQIEIITSKSQTPSPTWEKFVVTGKARGEIRKAIRLKQSDQYIKLGNAILTGLIASAKIENEQKAIASLCKSLKMKQVDLHYGLGEGTISRQEILELLSPKKSGLQSLFSFTKKAKSTPQKIQPVPVLGLIAGMAVHYAECCHPIPGDQIVGIIRSGTGIEIHTSDCTALNKYSAEQDRIIDLTWDSDTGNIPFICRLKAILNNHRASLATVTASIDKDEAKIINLKMTGRNPEIFDMIFDLEVESTQHFDKIINNLRTKSCVQFVERVKS